MNLEKSRIKRPDYLKRWITETHEAKTKIVALEKPTNKGRGVNHIYLLFRHFEAQNYKL